MRLIISRAIDQPEWDMDVLLKAFDSEREAREHCEPTETNPCDSFTPKRPFPSQTNKGKHVPTGATLTNQSEQLASCTFCKQSHSSASCGTVTDISAIRNLLNQTGRCFVNLFTAQPLVEKMLTEQSVSYLLRKTSYVNL